MERTWLDRIDELAEEHPEATALTVVSDPEERLSWRDLSRRTAGIARTFAARGLGQGKVLCLELPNGTGFLLSALAAWRLGATVAPLRWDLPEPERLQLRALAAPALSVTQAGQNPGEMALAEVLAALQADPSELPPAPIASPAWMSASGGSTGSPKLIAPKVDTLLREGFGMHFTAGRSNFADNADHRHPVHLVCTPLYHMHGFALAFRTLVEDFRVVVMERFEPELFLDLVERERVNFLALVPTIAVRLLKSPTIRDRDLSSVENVILGAGATPDWAIRELIELVGGEKVRLGYGMSESIAASFLRGDEWLEHPGSVGQPIGVETLVVDEDGKPLPTGEVGELYFRPIGGGGESFKYVGDATPRTLPGGWASVGDLGRLDADGYLYIVDRRTDMVKTGGANVFVSEVEAALLRHPDVADVAVVGLSDPEWGRRVHAIVQPREGADTFGLDKVLRDHCKQHLAAYKAPRSFEYVAELGRSEAGKINRQALARAREQRHAKEAI